MLVEKSTQKKAPTDPVADEGLRQGYSGALVLV